MIETENIVPQVSNSLDNAFETIVEHYQAGHIAIKRGQYYRKQKLKPGHIFYRIKYIYNFKWLYNGAYEMDLKFEKHLDTEKNIHLFLLQQLSKQLI